MAEENPNLTEVITTRFSKPAFVRLQKLMGRSNVRTMGEFIRAIVLKEKINWYHKNAELESLALEFAQLRKELNSIGRNINQITKYFHQAQAGQKIVQALKAEGEYRKVENKVNELLKLMERVTTVWSRK
jgi:hypothetical protein